jgi:spore germination protein GerM
MKQVFRTTVFRFVVIGWFGLYMKRFNTQRALQVSHFLVKNPEAIVIDNTRSELGEKLDEISLQITSIYNKLHDQTTQEEPSMIPTATAPTTVRLYYFNELEDSKLPAEQQINTNSIMPIQRTIRSSQNLIEDTIKILLQGNISEQEKDAWFITEFPNTQFRLLDTQLDAQWTLILTFNEVPWFTSGWSARMLILSKSIEKTALQFPQVTRVVFQPDTLFQP